MCIIHDLGEAFIGDIPAFEKTNCQEINEKNQLVKWIDSLPSPFAEDISKIYIEYISSNSIESKICKAIDNLEALIQHNQADLSTWLPIEYNLQLTYGDENVAFSNYLTELRKQIRNDSISKINI